VSNKSWALVPFVWNSAKVQHNRSAKLLKVCPNGTKRGIAINHVKDEVSEFMTGQNWEVKSLKV